MYNVIHMQCMGGAVDVSGQLRMSLRNHADDILLYNPITHPENYGSLQIDIDAM